MSDPEITFNAKDLFAAADRKAEELRRQHNDDVNSLRIEIHDVQLTARLTAPTIEAIQGRLTTLESRFWWLITFALAELVGLVALLATR